MHTLAENTHIVTVLAPDADRYNTGPATDIVNLGLYNEVTFVVSEGAGGTGTVKIEVEECSDNSGTGNTAIAFEVKEVSTLGTHPAEWTDVAATGHTTTAGANKDVLVRVRAAQTSDGKPWVRLQLTEVANDPVDAGVIAILSEPRYAADNPPSPL